MTRFETLPSGERINVDHVEQVRVEKLTHRWAVHIYMASSRCVGAGTFESKKEAEMFVAWLIDGVPAMFDSSPTLTPAQHARAVETWDAKTGAYL